MRKPVICRRRIKSRVWKEGKSTALVSLGEVYATPRNAIKKQSMYEKLMHKAARKDHEMVRESPHEQAERFSIA